MTTTCRGMPAVAGFAAVSLATVLALPPGARGGDELAIEKIMEQVHTRNRAIGKGLRIAFAPEAAGRKALAADAATLFTLGKEARTLTEPARERKKSQQEWTQKVDAFLRATEEFAEVIADPKSSQPRATNSYQKLQKTCLNCHSAFREGAD
jgi:cytochrome c'